MSVTSSTDELADSRQDYEKSQKAIPRRVLLAPGSGERTPILPVPVALGGMIGVFSVIFARDMWEAIRSINDLGDAFIEFSVSTDFQLPSMNNMWIVLILYMLTALLIAISFAKDIIDQTKEGWNYLYYALLLSTLNGVFFVIFLSQLDTNRGFITLISGLVGLYLLFQVHNQYRE